MLQLLRSLSASAVLVAEVLVVSFGKAVGCANGAIGATAEDNLSDSPLSLKSCIIFECFLNFFFEANFGEKGTI